MRSGYRLWHSVFKAYLIYAYDGRKVGRREGREEGTIAMILSMYDNNIAVPRMAVIANKTDDEIESVISNRSQYAFAKA